MTSPVFEVGDRVRLKGGGPVMVVSAVRPDGRVLCAWNAGRAFIALIYPTTLDLVDDDAGTTAPWDRPWDR